MKKIFFLFIPFFYSLNSFSQTDYAFVLYQDQAVTTRSVIKWNLSDNTHQQVISGIPLLPTQILVDSPAIFVVGERFFIYKFDFSTYALLDSFPIAQNTKARIHKDHLYTSEFSNPLTRLDKNTFGNSTPLSGTINGFLKSYVFIGDTAYLLSSGFNVKMRLHTINLLTMQVESIDSTLGTGSEAFIFNNGDTALVITYMNTSTNGYDVIEYSLINHSVTPPLEFVGNRSIAGFWGKFSGGKHALYAIDHPSPNKSIRRFSYSTKQVDTNFVSRTSSVFDGLLYNPFNDNLFLVETGSLVKRYDTTGALVGTNVQFGTGSSSVSDIGFHRQQPPASTTAVDETDIGNTSLKIYPNPSSDGILFFDFAGENYETALITIYNSMGAIVYAENINGIKEKYTMDLRQYSLSEGVYFIVISDGNKSAGGRVLFVK